MVYEAPQQIDQSETNGDGSTTEIAKIYEFIDVLGKLFIKSF